MGLSMMNMDKDNSGGHNVDMCSSVEDHTAGEEQMVPSTSEKARKKAPTTTTTGPKGEG